MTVGFWSTAQKREMPWCSSLIMRRRGIRVGEPAPATRFEAGDVVVVLGEPDSLAAAEIRLLQGTK